MVKFCNIWSTLNCLPMEDDCCGVFVNSIDNIIFLGAGIIRKSVTSKAKYIIHLEAVNSMLEACSLL